MKTEFYNFSKWYKFEKWLKKSKLEICPTRLIKSDYGKKTDKLILIFLWIIIDQFNFENYKKAKNIASNFKKPIPTIKQIAQFVKCHESYVKRIKSKIFNSEKSAYESETEFLNSFDNYGKIEIHKAHGFKDLFIQELETQQEIPKISRNNIFINSWKVKKVFYTFNKKVKCKLFFYKVSKIDFETIKQLMKSLKIKSSSKILERILKNHKFHFYFRSGWKLISEIKSRFKIQKNSKFLQELF